VALDIASQHIKGAEASSVTRNYSSIAKSLRNPRFAGSPLGRG
jgi:hypothetical protein